MDRDIAVSETTYNELAAMKDENESFEVVIRRLIERRKERIRNGSGYWDEEDAETAREQIDEMRDGFN